MNKSLTLVLRSVGMAFIFNTIVLFIEPFSKFSSDNKRLLSVIFVIGFYLINASFIWRENWWCKIFGHEYIYYTHSGFFSEDRTPTRVCETCHTLQRYVFLPFPHDNRKVWMNAIQFTELGAKDSEGYGQ